jgi:hypothetical protein
VLVSTDPPLLKPVAGILHLEACRNSFHERADP